MEHTDAIKLQAVEKYILGELSPAARNEFEAHYFDCVECSLSVRAGVAFAAAGRQYFAESLSHSLVLPPPKLPWFGWLKPRLAVPALAALVALVAYQNAVSIPRLQRALDSQVFNNSTVPPWFSLADSSVHGSSGTHIQVHPGQAFCLFFDITAVPRQSDSVFLLQIQDTGGKTLFTSTVPAERAQKSVLLPLPAGFHEGNYKLMITDRAPAASIPAGELPFTIAFYSSVEQH